MLQSGGASNSLVMEDDFVKNQSRSSQRPFYILAGAFVATVATLIVVFALMWHLLGPGSVAPAAMHSVCQSAGCIRASAELQQNMDLAVDPCQDFYKYACAGFEKKPFSVETINSGVLQIKERDDEMRARLFGILHNKDLVKSDDTELNSMYQAVRAVFQSCVGWYDPQLWWLPNATESMWIRQAEAFNQMRLIEPLFRVFRAELGIEEFLAGIMKTGMTRFISISYSRFSALPDSFHNLRRAGPVIQFKCMDFSRLIELNTTILTSLNAVEYLFQKTGMPINSSALEMMGIMAQVMIVNRTDMFVGNLTHLQSTTDAYLLGSKFNWTRFIGIFYKKTITAELPVFVNNLNVFLYAVKMLAPQLTAKNGVVYDFVRVASVMLTFNEFVARKDHNDFVYYCMDWSTEPFYQVVHLMYKSAHVNYNFSKISSILADVKSAMKQSIDSEAWISGKSKVALKSRIDNMKQVISNYEMPLNEMKELYQPVMSMIRRARHFGDILMARESARLRSTLWELTSETASVNFTTIHSNPYDVNAFYSPDDNSIYICAGMIDSVFNKDYPDYLLYGGIGSIIGHEIAHGFSNGVMHSDRTLLNKIFDNQSLAIFESKQQCLADSYSQLYYAPNATVNGSTSITETLADVLGSNAAFRAYKYRISTSGKTPMHIPGDLISALSSDKLFFVQSAQLNCHKLDSYHLRQMDFTMYPPQKERVLGMMKHSMWFAQVFGCKAGDPMYVDDSRQCRVW